MGTQHRTFKATPGRSTQDGVERICISTSDLDRDGDQLVPRGIVVDNYMKNPIVLWAHDSHALPIGRCVGISSTDTQVFADFTFLQDDEFATRVANAWKQQCLNATSVGFVPLQWEPLPGGGRKFTKWELLEFSVVPLPANAGATRGASMIRTLKSLGLWGDDLTTKGGRAISRENAAHIDGVNAMLVDLDATHGELRTTMREAQACLRQGKEHIDALLDAAKPKPTDDTPDEDVLDLVDEPDNDGEKSYDLDVIADAAKSAYSRPLHRRAVDRDGGGLIEVNPADITRAMADVMRQAIRDAVTAGTKDALNKLRGRLD